MRDVVVILDEHDRRQPADESGSGPAVLAKLPQRHPPVAFRQARAVGTNGIAPVPDELAADELAAWTSVARALLALHEAITRE